MHDVPILINISIYKAQSYYSLQKKPNLFVILGIIPILG